MDIFEDCINLRKLYIEHNRISLLAGLPQILDVLIKSVVQIAVVSVALDTCIGPVCEDLCI